MRLETGVSTNRTTAPRSEAGPMTMSPSAVLEDGTFVLQQYNDARPFASFLPGIAGVWGRPLWAFYVNRGQCVSSFGARNRDGAMLEFQPANRAYMLTPLHGLRTFLRLHDAAGAHMYEPFLPGAPAQVTQTLRVRAGEIEIEERHPQLGLTVRVVTFTLPGEPLPCLIRRVSVRNDGPAPRHGEILDGLPQVVPFGLPEVLGKRMSRTMEAFAEIRRLDAALPFFKLKTEPSDRAQVRTIDAGFFAFTAAGGVAAPQIVDPQLVFGEDGTLRAPTAFLRRPAIDPDAARRDTLTGCAFAALALDLQPGAELAWDSYFGHASDAAAARSFFERVVADRAFAARKRTENDTLLRDITDRFAVRAGPPELAPYTTQSFLDNTLRGGLPAVVHGPHGRRVFHVFTRKHGDTERDYNDFDLAPTFLSQGSANFRDVNQNRRNEHFVFPEVDSANLEAFFALLQIDGNNPLVVHPERFRVPAGRLDAVACTVPQARDDGVAALLQREFSPGELLQALLAAAGDKARAQAAFDTIVGQAETIQGAGHGEGYWVDHWIYNLDLLESYAAMFPDRLRGLMVERRDFTYHDSDHLVRPRRHKVVRLADGALRQYGAVVRDARKAELIERRTEDKTLMRTRHGLGEVYRTTLLAKFVGLLAVKASLLDPGGRGLEMDADKPGWCDALNGLPGLFGSSTHEARALRRGLAFLRRLVNEHGLCGDGLLLPDEVAGLLQSLTGVLAAARPERFTPTWERLAELREGFRESVRLGIGGAERRVDAAALRAFIAAADGVLARGLDASVDAAGLPISYFVHEATECDALAQADAPVAGEAAPGIRILRFASRPVAAFLEGAVHALRASESADDARQIHAAVRASSLYDGKLGMYRLNAPLADESPEIGRSRVFAPGWLENESVFLHMHYKYLLEMLRSGLEEEFYADLRRGLVAFHDPAVYGRSPLENSSFVCSSRFADATTHGAGFVARLSGATAEWISMVLHMALGAEPFRIVDGALRFEPRPRLADWLFTTEAGCGEFGVKLFGGTWLVYVNPERRPTFGPTAATPRAFTLHGADGTTQTHAGPWLAQAQARQLRSGDFVRVEVLLG